MYVLNTLNREQISFVSNKKNYNEFISKSLVKMNKKFMGLDRLAVKYVIRGSQTKMSV